MRLSHASPPPQGCRDRGDRNPPDEKAALADSPRRNRAHLLLLGSRLRGEVTHGGLMSFKSLQRTILAAVLLGGAVSAALAQFPPPPPLPGLEVRFSTGRPP